MQQSRPNLGQRLSKVLGTPFANGNLVFSGDSILSPVGNRCTIFDLVQQTTSTLPFETRKNIRRMAVSHSGRFLVLIDIEGHALFVNLPRRVVLHRFHFKRKVYDIKFSPDDSMFAVTNGHGCQIWRTPSLRREFSPLTLMRNIGGHNDDVVCLDWSDDGESLMMGSKDLGAKIYYRVRSKHMACTNLSGHRDRLVGVYFGEDGDSAYSIAQDGAVFTWTFEYGERKVKQTKKRRRDEDEDEENENEDDGSDSDQEKEMEEEEVTLTVRGGAWKLTAREFLWEPHTRVTATAFNRSSGLLVIGFDKGVFGLYEMPGCVNLQRLSVSNSSLNTVSMSSNGDWLGMGSSRLGQLLVWEWKSESYVLKQQGHIYGLNSLDYSHDGAYIATGGEDSKVKLWNASSGFCFMTFAVHVAPVTAVLFTGKGAGRVVLSASLDGTIRAHEMLRYKNFRTLVAPPDTPVQFTSLAADSSGDVICAGTLDPFKIYVWALQTGKLLDILAGHEGPIASLSFKGSRLASTSWDGTLKLWDVYQSTCTETFEHGCDVLAVAFRPDGLELCTAAVNGQIYIWDIESGVQKAVIEGRRDLGGGRESGGLRGGKAQDDTKCFTTLMYTSDGSCIMAGGKSKYMCVYSITTRVLVKKYQLSFNLSLDGVVDRINSRHIVDGIDVTTMRGDSDDDEHLAANTLPGAGKGSNARDGRRNTKEEVITSCVKFSPSGRDWAAATTQGLQIFSLDANIVFMPLELDESVTPQAIHTAIAQQRFDKAIAYSLQLGEPDSIRKAVACVPPSSIGLLCRSIDVRLLADFMRFLADELVYSRHIEFYLQWCSAILTFFGPFLQADSVQFQASLRALIRAVGGLEREMQAHCDLNQFNLDFLSLVVKEGQEQEQEGEGEAAET